MEFSNKQASKVRLCLIGNTKLNKMVHSLLPEFRDVADVTIIDSIFNDALHAARRLIEHDAIDVFMSAGANAFYLQDTLPVPVVALEMNQSDLFVALLKARAVSSDVLLLTHAHQQLQTDVGAYFQGLNIAHKTYTTVDEAKDLFNNMQPSRFGVVIGSSFVCDLAEAADIPYVMVYSRESCRNLIQRAIDRAVTEKRRLEQTAFAEFLLENTQTASIVTNADDIIVHFNPGAAQLIPGLKPQRRIDRVLDSRFLQSTSVSAESITLNERLCHVDKKPFEVNDELVGYLYRFRATPMSTISDAKSQSRLIHRSHKMSEVAKLLKVYGATPGTVLLQGETGTGKELAAREIHYASHFSEGPFIAINCAAIPSELFESELFGYADGAFTHSRSGGKSGLLESANNGTFFMDEINALPMPQQAKLLRVLQEREVRPVGSRRSIPLNIKFVAACHHDLMEEVRAGNFREDLYYRLNVFIVNLPPLKDRLEDLEPLMTYFMNKIAEQYQIEIDVDELIRELLPDFSHYNWPGNVRQLENLLERIVVSSSIYGLNDTFRQALRQIAPEIYQRQATTRSISHNGNTLQQVERRKIIEALERFNGNRTRTAEFLGISPTTLWRRLKELEL